MRPRAWPEGPRKAGIGQRRGCQAAPKCTWAPAPTARYGVASSSGRHCFALRGLALFYRNPDGTAALRAVCFVRLLAKGINHSRRRLSHSHPAKPPSRQRRFVQRFPGLFRASLRIQISQLVSLLTCSLSCLMMCCHYAAEVARADQLSARSWWSARKRRC